MYQFVVKSKVSKDLVTIDVKGEKSQALEVIKALEKSQYVFVALEVGSAILAPKDFGLEEKDFKCWKNNLEEVVEDTKQLSKRGLWWQKIVKGD